MRDAHGEIVRYKARLVACGNQQQKYQDDNFLAVQDFTIVE